MANSPIASSTSSLISSTSMPRNWPVTVLATSAGMELMFTVFVFYSFLALKRHLAEPNRATFLLLWTTLLITANVRYEGPVFLAAALAGLFAFKKLKAEWLNSWSVWLAPFMLLPLFWQRFCLNTNYENPDGVPVFSIFGFMKHTGDFVYGALSPGFYYPYAAAVNVLGFAGLAWFAVKFLEKARPGEESGRQLAWISLAGFALFWAVTASYYLGDPLHQSAARLFGVPVLALSLSAAAFAARLTVFSNRPWLAVFLAAAAFLVYGPVAAENRFMNALYLGREYRHELEFLRGLGDRNLLIVASRPGQFTPHEYGAVDFNYARENADQLFEELDRHLFSRILVIQKISYDTAKPVEDTEFGGCALKPVLEFQDTDTQFVRVSEASRG